MMTVSDIQNVTFERAMRGYRIEDVDEFLAKMEQELKEQASERERLEREKSEAVAAAQKQLADAQKEKEDLEKKLYVLADKIEQYRQDEENLKTALLNAQRLGESLVHEARQKAEVIEYNAKNKANQEKEAAAAAVASEEKKLVLMQAEVKKFKDRLLNMYRQHIEAINALPEPDEKPRPSSILFAVDETEAKAPAAPLGDKIISGGAPVPKTVRAPEPQPQAAVPAAEPPKAAAPAPKAPETVQQESFENYQGIQFDE